MSPSRTVWVTGATGYIGREVVSRLRARGHDVVALVRDPDRDAKLPELAGCRFHAGDLLDPKSLRGAADGADTVVHLVGLRRERGAQTFESVVVDGTAATVAEARRAGTKRFFFLSAIGSDREGRTRYFRTKGLAEELVRASGLEWLIVRSSIVLGERGEFLKILRDLVQPFPVVPVPGGGRFLLQPVLVDDVALAVSAAVERKEGWNRELGLCGPKVFEFRDLLRRVAGRRRRFYVPIPWPLMRAIAVLGETLLPNPPINRDELEMLALGSTCDPRPLQTLLSLRLRPVDSLLEGAS